MKTLRILMLALLLPAFVMTGCDKGNDGPTGGDSQIELPNENDKNQEAFADDETTGGFTFTAKQAWTATVTETGSTRASNVPWLRLLFDGEETYSGAAGTFNLVIELDENYSGKTRTATITIKSGNDTISITVTQDGKTEEGVVPVEPEKPNPDPEMKQVASVRVTTKSDDGFNDTWPMTFLYDTEGRLSSASDDDGSCTFSYASGKVTMTVAVDGEDDRVFTVALNGDGNAEKVTVQGEEYDEMLFAYDNGYIVKAENNYGDNHYFKWQNDNMVKYWLGGNGDEPADDDYSSQLLAYSSYRNNTTEIDLNTLFIEIPQPYFTSYQWHGGDVTKWLGFAGLLGKRSTNLTTDFFPVTVAYVGDTYSITNEIAKEPLLYTFDGDYPTVITGKYVIKEWKRYNDGVTELVSTTNYTDIYEISYVK